MKLTTEQKTELFRELDVTQKYIFERTPFLANENTGDVEAIYNIYKFTDFDTLVNTGYRYKTVTDNDTKNFKVTDVYTNKLLITDSDNTVHLINDLGNDTEEEAVVYVVEGLLNK